MTTVLRRRGGAAAALVMLALAVALTVVAWQEAAHLEHSDQDRAMLLALDAIEDELNGARVAQREFLRNSALASQALYIEGLDRAAQKLETLKRQAESHSELSGDLTRLERAAQAARNDLQQVVERFLAGAPAAGTLAASEATWRSLDAAVDDLKHDLRDELAAHSAELSTTLRYTLPGLLIAFAVFAPLAAYGLVSARSELSAKRRNEQMLRETNADLDARVRERTAELAERETRYRSLVAAIPGSVYRCRNDADYTMLVVSEGVRDITGYPPSDFLEGRRSFAGLIEADDLVEVRDSIEQAIARNAPFELVYRIRHAERGIRWVHERGRGVYDDNGELLLLDGIIFDVTVQHQAEERLHELHRTLEESERRFRQMAETIDDVFWIISADGERLLFVSPAFERVWGLRCSEVYTNRKLSLEAIHPDDAERARAAIAALSTGTAYDIEYRIRRPDGEERWIHGRGFPVRDAGGTVVLLTGVSADITQRKIDEANLQAANRETQAALEVAARKNVLLHGALRKQAEFLAHVSHELKTPLNAVIGFSELLLSGFAGALSEEQRQHVNEIHVAGEQLLGRINDVLDLASSQSGDAVLAVESVEPGALVVQALESLGSRARDAAVTVSLHAIDRLDSVALDPAKVTGLLRQLIANAIKFTPAGGRVDVTLEIVPPAAVPSSIGRAERYLAIRVSDTGVGMDEDVRARLFAPFEQGDGALDRAHGGLGIGLSIARHVARLHGGDIDIQSQPGAGTVVNVWFPIRPAPDAALARRPDAAAPGTGRLALVIEDDPPSATLVARQLESAGFEVKVAARGLEGLDLARTDRPALILLDLLLPDIDGWVLLDRLTEDPVLASTPVVIVSAVADRERGRAGGAKAVIQKPFQFEELDSVLAALSLKRAA